MDEKGCYTDSLDALKEVLDRLSPCEANKTVADLPYSLSVTPHSFEITCPAADGKRILAIFSDGKTASFSAL